MISPDTINAIFELGSSCLLTMNVLRLYKDKKLAGVALIPTAWFSLWGAWNLIYYHAIEQYLSWIAGMLVLIVNTTWVILALYYNSLSSNNKKNASN